MSNYMTIEEFHQRLGAWLANNPEYKNQLMAEVAVIQDNDLQSFVPGSILIELANIADDEEYESYGTLTILPPKTSKYVN